MIAGKIYLVGGVTCGRQDPGEEDKPRCGRQKTSLEFWQRNATEPTLDTWKTPGSESASMTVARSGHVLVNMPKSDICPGSIGA